MQVTPTRSAALELKEDRRAMEEGYGFLDEKCLLLAGEMLRQLEAYSRSRGELLLRHDAAIRALASALGRHGLEGLLVHAAGTLTASSLRVRGRKLMGVRVDEAAWEGSPARPRDAIDPSPEAAHCAQKFAEVLAVLPALAAAVGNLERLYREYRRCVRRARALHDVLLPELERDIEEIESRLQELEQEEAIALRRRMAAATDESRPRAGAARAAGPPAVKDRRDVERTRT